MRKFIVFLVISSILVFSFKTGFCAAKSVPDAYTKIAGNANLSLYFNPKSYTLEIEDMRNGYVWKSVVDDKVYDMKNINRTWQNRMNSLFIVNYVSFNEKNLAIKKAYSAGNQAAISYNNIDNGIRLNYEFKNIKIKISFEIKLDKDFLVVNIPMDGIEESDINGIVSVELMPFLGAADSKVDGYILCPDGSGSLMKYKNVYERPEKLNEYKWYIYSPEDVSINDKNTADAENENTKRAMLPVYGVKNGDNAFLAIADKGEENTCMNVSPEGYTVNLNRASFEFTYRHFFEVMLSNITINGTNMAKVPEATKVDKKIINQTHEVRYAFLEGNDANYSGMANAYRDYLISNNALKKAISDKKIHVAIDFLMGIKEKRLIFNKYVVMTSFKQAKEILEKLSNKGIKNIQVKLDGWAKGGYGYYPVNWPPERSLGGKKGFDLLSEYVKNNDMKIFLSANFEDALSKSRGFSKRKDVIFDGAKMPVTNESKDSFLLSPYVAYNKFKNFIGNMSDQNSNGIALDRIGELIYHDYNTKNPSTRSDTEEKWKAMMELASKQNGGVALNGGNLYTLKYADRLYDIPVESSHSYISDEDVPFYQMVVHGMIPYSSEPGNLFYDSTEQKLKWIEYGCMPYFQFTYKKSRELKYTDYNKLFTSYYNDWINTAADIYDEFNGKLSSIWDEYMIGHDKVDDNLYRVRYGNGTTVYINYNESDKTFDGYKIKAKDYLVIEKGGIVK
ncbi:MAG TPA: hypothetical protein DD426_09900 [Clostridiaceae bacterium]|nr:hypothetical protein [Clostridiaceae bacterium]